MHAHECSHSPLPTFALPSLCFSFNIAFLPPCLLPTFFCLIKWYSILLTITFRSEIAKDLGEWDKSDHWRFSVLLLGHMVFHSIWKLEFCPVVLYTWEYQAFQPLNWGLRFIRVTLSTYFCPVRVISLEEMNKQGEQNKQISTSLVWACWTHPGGFHRKDKFPLLIYIWTLLLELCCHALHKHEEFGDCWGSNPHFPSEIQIT